MTPLLALAALAPGLYWDRGPDTADQLKKAGIERVYVPPAQEQAWKQAGFAATGIDINSKGIGETISPGVQYRVDVASATRLPWIDSNGWRYLRDQSRTHYCDAKPGAAALALFEAFTYGTSVAIRAAPEDLESFGRAEEFLRRLEPRPLPPMANIGIVDDGSEEMGEVLNLLNRRNLLFQVVRKPDRRYDLGIQLGTKEWPREEATDPGAFATDVRRKLTDGKRLLRLYGSEVVIGRLAGDGRRTRLFLLNYGRRRVTGLRVRVVGEYGRATVSVFGLDKSDVTDYLKSDGATEFSIPEMNVFAVVDLER